jgi:hypothetical protein
VAFGVCRRFEFFEEPVEHFPGNRIRTTFVLREDRRQRRFEIDDLDARTVIGEKVDPPLSRLAQDIGPVELLLDNEGPIGDEVRRFLWAEMFVVVGPSRPEQVRRAGVLREVIARRARGCFSLSALLGRA